LVQAVATLNIDRSKEEEKQMVQLNSKCSECLRIAEDLGHRTPKGWKPFAWGSTIEESKHFYVFLEDTTEPPKNGTPQQLDVQPLCKIPLVVRR
jgi:hypothetical protein